MKKIIRRNVFETNSSSTHSITIIKNYDEDKARLVTDNFEKLVFLIHGVLNEQSNIQEEKLKSILEIYLNVTHLDKTETIRGSFPS